MASPGPMGNLIKYQATGHPSAYFRKNLRTSGNEFSTGLNERGSMSITRERGVEWIGINETSFHIGEDWSRVRGKFLAWPEATGHHKPY